MPWQEESTMELRRQFIQDVQSGATPITELCVAYGISRKTGYKWLTRYEAGGLTALGDQSRQPRTSPTATPSELVQALLEARHHHPTWGPRKLLRLLRQREPSAPWPARSTIALHLHRAECRLDGGLQGAVPSGRRDALLSAYDRRWLQPHAPELSRAHHHPGRRESAGLPPRVPGVRPTHPHSL